METVISDTKGDSESVKILRSRIQAELDKGNTVKVKLLQPGVMYQQDGVWKTVIDFMNEWAGKSVSFMSNLVPLAEVKVPFQYSNDMFFAGHKLYQQDPQCVKLRSKLIKQKKPKYYFDMLLGDYNDWKDMLFEQVSKHPVRDKTFLTYYRHDTSKGSWSEDVVQPKKHTAETMGPLSNRFNTQVRCSDLIDPAIYNNTYYSVMIETVFHTDFAMFSEKEAKPIVAKRPFLIFGSPGHLKAFRQLGFKSFHTVIDESYDNIIDNKQRFAKVLDCMHKLCAMDPKEVFEKLDDVLEHNKNHFENSEWKFIVDVNSYR